MTCLAHFNFLTACSVQETWGCAHSPRMAAAAPARPTSPHPPASHAALGHLQCRCRSASCCAYGPRTHIVPARASSCRMPRSATSTSRCAWVAGQGSAPGRRQCSAPGWRAVQTAWDQGSAVCLGGGQLTAGCKCMIPQQNAAHPIQAPPVLRCGLPGTPPRLRLSPTLPAHPPHHSCPRRFSTCRHQSFPPPSVKPSSSSAAAAAAPTRQSAPTLRRARCCAGRWCARSTRRRSPTFT